MPTPALPPARAARAAFVEHCLELLAPLGAPRSRRMFGGHGLYVDDLFIALVIEERLYLKADDSTRTQFEAAGCEPFVYEGAGKTVTINYWTAPEEALDSPALMLPWGRLALQAAIAKRAAKPSARAVKRPPTAAPTRGAASPAAAKTKGRSRTPH